MRLFNKTLEIGMAFDSLEGPQWPLGYVLAGKLSRSVAAIGALSARIWPPRDRSAAEIPHSYREVLLRLSGDGHGDYTGPPPLRGGMRSNGKAVRR